MIEVGKQVVCIYTDYQRVGEPPDYLKRPVVGSVYTVRAIIRAAPHRVPVGFEDSLSVGLLLEEVVNQPYPTWPDGAVMEAAWSILDFRPVKPTSIDVFIAMTKPVQTFSEMKNRASLRKAR